MWKDGRLLIDDFASSGAYDDAGNPTILVFTVDECGGHCRTGIKEL